MLFILGLHNSHEELKNTVHNAGLIFIAHVIKAFYYNGTTYRIDYDEIYEEKPGYCISEIFPYRLKKNLWSSTGQDFAEVEEEDLDSFSCITVGGSINKSGENFLEIINKDEHVKEIMMRNKGNCAIAYDDITLENGRVIISSPKTPYKGGHNGVKNIEKFFPGEFFHIRIGVKLPTNADITEFVLSEIKPEVKSAIQRNAEIFCGSFLDRMTTKHSRSMFTSRSISIFISTFKNTVGLTKARKRKDITLEEMQNLNSKFKKLEDQTEDWVHLKEDRCKKKGRQRRGFFHVVTDEVFEKDLKIYHKNQRYIGIFYKTLKVVSIIIIIGNIIRLIEYYFRK